MSLGIINITWRENRRYKYNINFGGGVMLTERAVEIINSLGVINVTYKNNPVWIEDIERESNKIQVKDLKTNEVIEVEALDLVENIK